MCGIVGALNANESADSWCSVLDRMARSLAHRGPDDQGIWLDADAGIGLAHRRLAIVDRSVEGHQPMHSVSGRYILCHNGEIYNQAEIRQTLERTSQAPVWRGHSDTEVMCAAFDAWGIERAIKLFAGIFAFALWDRKKRTVYLGRDHLGVKPLYYGETADGVFLFGSELKALRAHPSFTAEVDRDAVALFMRYGYVPTPRSIYCGIEKLLPGTILAVRSSTNGFITQRWAYWTARSAFELGQRNPIDATDSEVIGILDRALRTSVRAQMASDVPLGSFLSGGIDSSTVTAMMQAESTRPIKTFSLGYLENDYDETPHARAIASYLGTDHSEMIVTPQDALLAIPDLACIWDEPFADSSQLPTYLLAKMARHHVGVCLSGDGGDELFCGYTRYTYNEIAWREIVRIPRPVRAALISLITSISVNGWNRLALITRSFLRESPGEVLYQLAARLSVPDRPSLYRRQMSNWSDPESVVIGSIEPNTVLNEPSNWPIMPDFEHLAMYLDIASYLPDNILVKLDRATMAVGLESRVPLLDHRFVELVARLPLRFKLRQGQPKWILRQVLSSYVPTELYDRPKMGFGVPLDTWLRGSLRPWAEELLDDGRLRRQGFFSSIAIRKKWEEHLSGKKNWHYVLWSVLMFQNWLEHERAE